jgi:large subunit ribosomal protein L11
LKRVTGRAKGAATPGHETVGTVSVKALFEIARARQAADPRLQSEALEALTKSVAASARGMGFKLTR